MIATRLGCLARTVKKEGSPEITANPPTISPGYDIYKVASWFLSISFCETTMHPARVYIRAAS